MISSKVTVPYMITLRFHTRDASFPLFAALEEDSRGSFQLEQQYICIVTSSSSFSSLNIFKCRVDCISNFNGPLPLEERISGRWKETGTEDSERFEAFDWCRSRT
jgi:hypothetical protein